VLRGGNSTAGELVGRCANALGRAATTKSATMGFRCCAGPRNPRENDLALAPRPPLEGSGKPKELAAPLVQLAAQHWGAPWVPTAAWSWHPVANEELVIATGCAGAGQCGVIVGRAPTGRGGQASSLAEMDSALVPGEVVQLGEARHLRMRGLDVRGAFLREFTYSYGRIDKGELRRH